MQPPYDPNGDANPDPSERPPAAEAGGYDYQKFLDAWWHAAPGTNLDKFISDNPGFTKGAKTSHGGEYLDLPGGESFDAYANYNPDMRTSEGSNRPQWGSSGYDYQTGAALTPAQSQAAEAAWAAQHPGGGGGGGVAGPAPASTGVTGAPGGKYSDQISEQILKLLQKGNTPVTEQDMAAQYEPVSRTFQRGAQRAREGAAERMAYSGLNSGGSGGPLDAEVNSINESLAEKQAGTMGNLMQQELQARRNDVVNAIGFAQGEEKQALQLQLAQIDKELRQQALNLQGKGMDLQNQQYYDRLGFDMSSHKDSLDALLASYLS